MQHDITNLCALQYAVRLVGWLKHCIVPLSLSLSVCDCDWCYVISSVLDLVWLEVCHALCTGQNSPGQLIPECPPIWVTAVLFGGPFAAALRLLLQNGSIMELGSKGRIYGELLRLLGVLGSVAPDPLNNQLQNFHTSTSLYLTPSSVHPCHHPSPTRSTILSSVHMFNCPSIIHRLPVQTTLLSVH